MEKIYDMIIIGGGPAGYTAALYAVRAGLRTLLLEKLYAGESLQSVADQLSYSSPYSFSKAFKKHFGSSPVQYVNALKRNEPAVIVPPADGIIKN